MHTKKKYSKCHNKTILSLPKPKPIIPKSREARGQIMFYTIKTSISVPF